MTSRINPHKQFKCRHINYPPRNFRIAIYLLVSFGYLLTGCQPTASKRMPTQTVPYMLMTLNGSGGGKYQPGDTVHIWANPYERGWTFEEWIGDTQFLPDVRSMHATIIMPAQDIRIGTTYKRIPIWNASFTTLFGRDVYYYFPEKNDKGVILFFHGSGGDARDWSSLGAERRHFFDDVIAAGYAIIAIDSTDRVNKQWDLRVPPASNPDLEAVETILESFAEMVSFR